MNVKIIVFDLDDTLYNEIDYVKSGFKEVTKYFAKKYKLESNKLFDTMMQNLNQFGRGKIFDRTLSHFNILNKLNVKKCISIYRKHLPNIKLPQESQHIIDYYKALNIPMYLVTDGNKIVQYNKIKALNIEKYFNKVFITHRYGIKNAKPSTYCFKKISQKENISFEHMVYIGDNINKDFIGIKPLGIKTIRLKNGMYKNEVLSKAHNADIEIESLSQIKEILKIEG